MGQVMRALGRERQAWGEQMREQAGMTSTLVIVAAIIAAVRLARDPDISGPSHRLTCIAAKVLVTHTSLVRYASGNHYTVNAGRD
jgi:hypothetical protein